MSRILYIFWDKGIDYNAFCLLPIPYIFTILDQLQKINKEQEQRNKRKR